MAETGAPPEKVKDKGEPFKKGDPKSDLSEGPIKKRCCTDLICCLVFPAAIVLFVIVSMAGMLDGNPHKLYLPRDYRGGYCGLGAADQWGNGSMDLSGHKWKADVMNVTAVFGVAAREMLCEDTVKTLLTNAYGNANTKALGMSAADFDKACVKPNATSWPNMSTLTDPSQALGALEGGMDLFNSASNYFTPVCLSACDSKSPNTMSDARAYNYVPAGDETWKPVWDKVNMPGSPVAPMLSSLGGSAFKAWPKSVCPYDAVHCVPYPGMSASESPLSPGYCIPTIDSGLMKSMTNGAMTGMMNGLSKMGDLGANSFGTMMGELMEILWAIVIVGIAGLVIGFIFLILLRFVIKPIVWVALLAAFCAFALAGLLAFMRAAECADTAVVDAGKLVMKAPSEIGSVFTPSCPNGFQIPEEALRTGLQICGYIVWGCGALWLLTLMCLCSRINLACAINQAAALFFVENPQALLFPILQAVISTAWSLAWMFSATFLLSQVPADYLPTTAMTSWADGGAKTTGKCVNIYPQGFAYKEPMAQSCIDKGECWFCAAPRWMVDAKFGYSFFVYLWIAAFVIACTQCIIAGAVGNWFFTKRGQKLMKPVFCISIKNTVLYHLGSMAFGSFILAVVQWIKYFLHWVQKQAEAQGNVVLKYLACIVKCLVACFEKCIEFLNKNAYIQIALTGTNFCGGAKAAFKLIIRNALRFFVVCSLAWMVHFIGFLFIMAGTCVVGWFILQSMYPLVNPIFPMIVFGILAFMISKIFMAVFGLAVDTTLQSFIIAEELGDDCVQDFVPNDLKGYIDSNAGKNESKGCCSCCG